MKFKTTFPVKKAKISLNHQHNLWFIGSCFSEHISQRLKNRKFQVESNPFGILYNPISIFQLLENILAEKTYQKADLIQHNSIWSCFDFHSDMSAENSQQLLDKVNASIIKQKQLLTTTHRLFISLGTAWVYTFEEKIVANCHKIPSTQFQKKLLSIDEIVKAFNILLEKLKANNPKLEIIFTISPVRHLRDGFIENNQSKATLHLAVKKIVAQHTSVHYFPAYELLIDDLRDYRFFDTDMLHPNTLAIKYISEVFDAMYFNENTKNLVKKIDKLNQALQHKVKFPESENYRKFQEKIQSQIKELENLGIFGF